MFQTRRTTRITALRMMAGDRAGAQAWQRRGWQHLEDVGPCLERGYHAVACVGCDIHDPATLLELAELALGVARDFGDRALELRATGDKGLALVSSGSVDEGFALLDEVMVGIVAGDIPDPQMRGITLSQAARPRAYCPGARSCRRNVAEPAVGLVSLADCEPHVPATGLWLHGRGA